MEKRKFRIVVVMVFEVTLSGNICFGRKCQQYRACHASGSYAGIASHR